MARARLRSKQERPALFLRDSTITGCRVLKNNTCRGIPTLVPLSHHPARPQGLWDGPSCLNRGRMCLVSPAAVGYRSGVVVVADWDASVSPVYSVLEIGPAPATCTPIHGRGRGGTRTRGKEAVVLKKNSILLIFSLAWSSSRRQHDSENICLWRKE